MANLTSPAVGRDADDPGSGSSPPVFNYVLSFVLVGLAWGLTTPFIRAAARTHRPRAHPLLERPSVRASRLRRAVLGAAFAALDLLRNPRYAVPLLINLTGSVWFFLLIGQAGMLLVLLLWPASEVVLTLRCRAELDGAHCQHHGFPLYRAWRVVCRGQGHQQR